jgi:hypothetical protein
MEVKKSNRDRETSDENGHLKKPAVLAAFKGCASVTKACEIVDICRQALIRRTSSHLPAGARLGTATWVQ